MNLLFKISYGLYVLSARDGDKDNACIINTFAQQTAAPEKFSVTVNKLNMTTDIIAATKKCVVSVLSNETSFELIKNFGMQSGKSSDKFLGVNSRRAENGIIFPTDRNLGYFEMDVVDSIDFGTHIMFLLEPSKVTALKDGEPLTYAYYQSNIKPKPAPPADDDEETWVCKICGYIHKGKLPADFICPLCKHPASDFERISKA